jgi:hypothetical protein
MTMPPTTQAVPATRPERAATAALVLLAGIAGWLSYASVRAAAVHVFGTVGGSAFPVLLDAGVFASSEYYLASVRKGRPSFGFRTLTRALIAATVAINVSTATDWRAALMHAVPPALFAALVELRARQILGDQRAALGVERIPLKLWIVSPVRSFRITLHVARQGAHGALWVQREQRAAALRALRIAVPGRGQARRARRQAASAIRSGMLAPADLIAATGLDDTADGTGPAAVLRVALRASLGASGSQGVNASESASRMQSGSASRARIPAASVAGQAAIVMPQMRRIRNASASASKRAGESASEARLKADALDLDRASIAETNAPAGLRQLQRELGIGQARATELRAWLAAQREQFAEVEHVNGHGG